MVYRPRTDETIIIAVQLLCTAHDRQAEKKQDLQQSQRNIRVMKLLLSIIHRKIGNGYLTSNEHVVHSVYDDP